VTDDVNIRVRYIEARAAAATKGPWRVDDSPQDYLADAWGLDDDDRDHRIRSACWLTGPAFIDAEDDGIYFSPVDADFIANAREDVPYLLELLRAAQRMDHFLQHELVMFSDEANPRPVMDIEMRQRLDDEADLLHAALREPTR